MVKHKAKFTNQVANVLSQRNNLLTAMRLDESSFDSFCDLLDTNPYFSAIMSVVRAVERSNFILHDEFLFKGNQLCVLNCSLRLRMIQELHDEGHVGRLVCDSYF